jgi:hypothetical protein
MERRSDRCSPTCDPEWINLMSKRDPIGLVSHGIPPIPSGAMSLSMGEFVDVLERLEIYYIHGRRLREPLRSRLVMGMSEKAVLFGILPQIGERTHGIFDHRLIRGIEAS